MEVHNVALDVSQVELVEQVVEVHAELQPCVLAQHRQLGYAKRLAKSRVHIEIAGAPERIAGNSGSGRNGSQTDLAGRTIRGHRCHKETLEKSAARNIRRREERLSTGGIGR